MKTGRFSPGRSRSVRGVFRCLSVALLLSAVGAVAAADGRRPNVVVILADDLGRSDLSCFGGEIATPNLDRLAAQGLRFTQAYNGGRCCPSRAALVSGVYAHAAGVGQMVDGYGSERRAATGSPAYRDFLAPEIPTLADVLGAAGYRTWMSGKWHLGLAQPAHLRGFQRSFSLPRGAMNYFGRGAQHDPKVELLEDGKPWPFPERGFYSTVAFTDWALARLREHDAKAPFFLYLAYNAPHWPLHALPEDIAAQRGRYDAGYDVIHARRLARQRALGLARAGAEAAPRPAAVPAWETLTADERAASAREMEVYAAQVACMDREVGRLIAALEERGELDRTLVFFFSDNGAEPQNPANFGRPEAEVGSAWSYRGYGAGWAWVSNAPSRLFKCFSHEGGVTGPALAFWPAGIARPGRDVAEPIHLIDVAATSAAVAGVAWPGAWRGLRTPPLDGVSLLPVFQGHELGARPLFFEHEGTRAVRDGRWKLVATNRGAWELYDVIADPGEIHDLAATHPDQVQALAGAWRRWAERVGVRDWPVVRKP